MNFRLNFRSIFFISGILIAFISTTMLAHSASEGSDAGGAYEKMHNLIKYYNYYEFRWGAQQIQVHEYWADRGFHYYSSHH